MIYWMLEGVGDVPGTRLGIAYRMRLLSSL
jgi:hypothetical protein